MTGNLPTGLSDADWLTPWAAESRYDGPIAMDRAAALTLAGVAVGWVEARLNEHVGDGKPP